jgi:hypothetical protein
MPCEAGKVSNLRVFSGPETQKKVFLKLQCGPLKRGTVLDALQVLSPQLGGGAVTLAAARLSVQVSQFCH